MNATSKNSPAEFERLLNETCNLLEKRRVGLRASTERLLVESKPHLERIKRNEELTAPRFNVFDALGVVRKEVIQSRFLAYLLSPSEQHKQGAKLLNAFLERIGAESIIESDWALVKVRREGPADEYGRIDIVITAPKLLVAIEIKIDADERFDQIADYQKWMKDKKYANKNLIFITPSGRHPNTNDAASEIEPFPLSYAELAEIFSPLILTIIPCSVRTVIEQYITACRLITLGEIAMTTPDKDLIALLTKPNNLKTAFEIEQQMTQLRSKFVEEFCANVLDFIQKNLENNQIKWSTSKLGSYAIKISPCDRSHSNYCLDTKLVDGVIIWYSSCKTLSEQTKDLIKRMRSNGISNKNWESNYLCIEDLRKDEGKMGYTLSSNEDIITCFEDNKDNDHPLARKIADKTWKIFCDYREAIEKLPDF